MENTFYEDTFCPELRQGYKSLVPVFRDLHIEDTFYENTLCPRAMLRDMVTLTYTLNPGPICVGISLLKDLVEPVEVHVLAKIL